MAINIYIHTDKTEPGSEEITNDLIDEIIALDVGTVKPITEETSSTTLGWVDLETIGLVVTIAKLSIDLYKIVTALIDIAKENRLRYADKKKVDPDNAPRIKMELLDEESKVRASLTIPSNRIVDENRFIQIIKGLGGKDEAEGNPNN